LLKGTKEQFRLCSHLLADFIQLVQNTRFRLLASTALLKVVQKQRGGFYAATHFIKEDLILLLNTGIVWKNKQQ